MAIDMQDLEDLTALLPEPDLAKVLKFSLDNKSIIGQYLWKEKKVAVQLMTVQHGMILPFNTRLELEVLVIFEGSLEVEMSGTKKLYGRGQVVQIPAGAGHICQAISNVKLIAISIPASEEYPDE